MIFHSIALSLHTDKYVILQVMAMKEVFQRYSILLLLMFFTVTTGAQDIEQTDKRYSVSGVVTDQRGKQLPYVNVNVSGERVSTVTNEDGFFTIKTMRQVKALDLSHVGYQTLHYEIPEFHEGNLVIKMKPSTVVLNDIVVRSGDAKRIFYEALDKITDNYPQHPEMMKCFYRECVQKRSRYINIAEAVANLYKPSYKHKIDLGRVSIEKGRRLVSPKTSDTLGVKILGGPNTPIYLDFVKNKDFVLDPEDLTHYEFTMEDPVITDNRLQFVIRITPIYAAPWALYEGVFHIDQETLAFTRAELSLDMRDREKATTRMLVRKPIGVRFKPREMSVTVSYTTQDNVTRINYVRTLFRFNCDWKKRLFSTSFTAMSELVVTDWTDQDVHPIKGRDTFYQRDAFFDKVDYFDDPNFWADYNIIEPTESLENAIGKLRKKY